MKATSITAALFAALLAASPTLAVNTPQTLIVSFDNNTPAHVVDEVMAKCIDIGGKITHTFEYLAGFVMVAPVDAQDAMTAFGQEFAQYNMVIEEDQKMTVLSGR